MTVEELDVCRNLACSADRAFRSKRMLRILSRLQEKGLIEFDPFGGKATLTPAGVSAISAAESEPQS